MLSRELEEFLFKTEEKLRCIVEETTKLVLLRFEERMRAGLEVRVRSAVEEVLRFIFSAINECFDTLRSLDIKTLREMLSDILSEVPQIRRAIINIDVLIRRFENRKTILH